MNDIRSKMKGEILKELKSLEGIKDLNLKDSQLEAIITIQLDIVLLNRFKGQSMDAKNKRIIEGIEFI